MEVDERGGDRNIPELLPLILAFPRSLSPQFEQIYPLTGVATIPPPPAAVFFVYMLC